MAETAEENQQQDSSESITAKFNCSICADDADIINCGHFFWYVNHIQK